MPKTAALVDELREVFGAGVVRKGAFYAAEVGADGELHEYGQPLPGMRAQTLVDGQLVHDDRPLLTGWGVAR